MRTVAEVKMSRAARISQAKDRSEKEKRTVKLSLTGERFLYDKGSLIEYEYVLPESY